MVVEGNFYLKSAVIEVAKDFSTLVYNRARVCLSFKFLEKDHKNSTMASRTQVRTRLNSKCKRKTQHLRSWIAIKTGKRLRNKLELSRKSQTSWSKRTTKVEVLQLCKISSRLHQLNLQAEENQEEDLGKNNNIWILSSIGTLPITMNLEAKQTLHQDL